VLKCTTAKASANTKGGTTVTTETGGGADWALHTVTVSPTFSGCTGFGQNLTVAVNECTFTGTVSGGTKTPGPYVEGTVTIDCPTGKSIVITGNTTKCTITIGAQTPANNVIDVYNEGEGATADLKIRATVGTEPLEAKKTGIKYTSSGGACGASGENGVVRGDGTAKCFTTSEHKTQVGCTIVETVEETGSKKIRNI
jgi:hypothetical protein